MINPKPAVLLVALSLCAPALLPAQAPADTGSTIVASGQGELTLTPDRVVVVFDVSTRESSANAATTKNGTLVKRVVDSLSALRETGDTVQLIGIAVHQNQNFPDGRLIDYQASGTVRFALRRLDQLGHVIDAAFAAGATGIDNVTFLSDKEEAAVDTALGRAYQRAEGEAQALARVAGMHLGVLLRVATDYLPTVAAGTVMGAPQLGGIRVGGYGQAPISPQDIRVSATVHATWRLRSAAP